MKKLATLFLLVLSLSSFCQDDKNNSRWCNCMKGTIEKYPVTMHLHKWGKNYSGYYYYDRSQEPMDVSGADFLELLERTN